MLKLKAFDEEPFITEMRNKQSWNDRGLKEVRKKIKIHLKNICSDKCFFCKSSVRGRDVNIEHLVSKTNYKMFTYKPENLILSCSDCNSLKNSSGVFTSGIDTTLFNSWDDYPMKSEDYKIIHPYIDKYEKHLVRIGIIYQYIDSKGLETIKAYNLDRLSLAEKNAIADNYLGVLFDIRNDPSIEPEEVRKIMEEVLNPKPKYAPFDEYINVKLRGADAFSEELINSINSLDGTKFASFDNVIKTYNNTASLQGIEFDKLKNTLEILEIIKELIKVPNDRRDVRVICSYNIEEISKYWRRDIFVKSNSEQVSFAIKLLDILQTLKSLDFILKDELIIDYINIFIGALNDSIKNIGA